MLFKHAESAVTGVLYSLNLNKVLVFYGVLNFAGQDCV